MYFWTACEQYRSTVDQELRRTIALNIYAKHLACDAIEPVNVDSKASNLTVSQIEQADHDLFLQACLNLLKKKTIKLLKKNNFGIYYFRFRHKNKYLI